MPARRGLFGARPRPVLGSCGCSARIVNADGLVGASRPKRPWDTVAPVRSTTITWKRNSPASRETASASRAAPARSSSKESRDIAVSDTDESIERRSNCIGPLLEWRPEVVGKWSARRNWTRKKPGAPGLTRNLKSCPSIGQSGQSTCPSERLRPVTADVERLQ